MRNQGKNRRLLGKVIIVLAIMLMTSFPNPSHATSSIDDKPKVLVIYTTEDGEINENQRYLDLLIGHFTTDIKFISSEQVEKNDLISVTHLFYYGQVATKLPDKFITLFDDYEGTFVAIGYNVEQLGDQFEFLDIKHEVTIDQLYDTTTHDSLAISQTAIVEVEASNKSEILIHGQLNNNENNHPVLIKQGNRYYYAFDTFDSRQVTLFAEALHDIFQIDHEEKYVGYIRLEDVHPLVDPEPLKEIANLLNERNIPFMVAVIPIYTKQGTGERITFADSPKLVKVLKHIQKTGGSIVLHGYTHQFRSSETGEGFEFWDVENNTPIYGLEDEPFTLKSEHDFSSKAEFENYLNNLKEFERTYTETKINKGLDELAKYGLYPLAFEAPHYTMSQHGYEILSKYFSTYVGQVQLSDQNWEIMDTAPYITTPSFLHGMELLPETMGYVRPHDQQAVKKIIDRTERIQLNRDGIFSVFYHPYLGSERFEELLAEIEKLPNISWIDLKQMDVWVKGDHIEIHTNNGQIIADYNHFKIVYSSLDAPLYYIGQFVQYAAWIMTYLGLASICAFVFFTIFLKLRNKQVEG